MKTKSAWFIINDIKGKYLGRDVVHGFDLSTQYVPSDVVEEMEQYWGEQFNCEIYITDMYFVETDGEPENGEEPES